MSDLSELPKKNFFQIMPYKNFMEVYKVKEKCANICQHIQFICLQRFRYRTSIIRLQFWLTTF